MISTYTVFVSISFSSFRGKKKTQFALPSDGLSEGVSIHSIKLDRLFNLR